MSIDIDIDIIVYALEHCVKDAPCKECPYYEKGFDCQEKLMKDAALVIKAFAEPLIKAIMNSEEE